MLRVIDDDDGHLSLGPLENQPALERARERLLAALPRHPQPRGNVRHRFPGGFIRGGVNIERLKKLFVPAQHIVQAARQRGFADADCSLHHRQPLPGDDHALNGLEHDLMLRREE